jgi:hypothetical protein
MRLVRAFALALVLTAVAGCVQQTPSPAAPSPVAQATTLSFLPAVTVDGARIASEPSIKVMGDGMIFVSAPTGQVKYATRPQDALTEADKGIGQSAIWRSKDGGATFQFLAGLGPSSYHDTLPGGGDSDLAIDGKGTIYMTDQFGLAVEDLSVSTDHGNTWTEGSGMASGEPDVDRQWLWPDPDAPGTVYMNFDHNTQSIDVSKTTDGGKTWTATQAADFSTSPGPIVATHSVVAFSAFDGNKLMFVHSADKGKTWKQDEIAQGHKEIADLFPGTVADQAGTLYVSWLEKDGNGGTEIGYVFSKDDGKSWSAPRVLADRPGTAVFMWSAAGAAGRLGFSWYDAPDPQKSWMERAAVVTGADTDAPVVTQTQVSDKPTRVGPPCTDGTACTSGREYGDFQQCAIGPDGKLVIAYVTVLSAQDGGRITFAKEASGPALLDAPPSPWVV